MSGYILRYEREAEAIGLKGWNRYFIANLKGGEKAIIYEKVANSAAKYAGTFDDFDKAFEQVKELLKEVQ